MKGKNGAPNGVKVTDDDMDPSEVTEEEYHRMCFKPPLDDLPWCEH